MTRPRSRRALLRTGVLAVGGLAGCVGGLADDPSETTRQTSTAETETTTENPPPTQTTESPAVELLPVAVQSSFFYLTSPESMDVAATDGTQFVFVMVRPRTDSPPPSDFALAADGSRFWGTLAPGDVGGPHRIYELGASYRSGEDDAGWVAFEVPDPLDAESVALTYRGRRWPLGDDYLDALREPPADFELLSFDAPDRVSHDESFEVSLTVENSGDGDGVFRASLNQAGPTYVPHRAEFAVAAGERREWTWTLGEYVTPETERVGLRLESPDADRETTVEVAD